MLSIERCPNSRVNTNLVPLICVAHPLMTSTHVFPLNGSVTCSNDTCWLGWVSLLLSGMESIVMGSIRWCVWSIPPSSPLRGLRSPYVFVCLFVTWFVFCDVHMLICSWLSQKQRLYHVIACGHSTHCNVTQQSSLVMMSKLIMLLCSQLSLPHPACS